MAEIALESEVIEIPELDISHLITEDDTPVDNIFSEKQQRLLTESLYTSWKRTGKDPLFIALANVGLFYNINNQAVVPDVLVSLDVQLPEEVWQKKHRSYFIWEYGKPPEVVIEVVSNRKGGELTEKRHLYARLGIAYYIVYDPDRRLGQKTLHLYELRGTAYAPMNKQWLPGLGLGVLLWDGAYEGLTATWLRWQDQAGSLILTGAEALAQEQARTRQEQARATQEQARADRLAAQLQALGIDPDA